MGVEASEVSNKISMHHGRTLAASSNQGSTGGVKVLDRVGWLSDGRRAGGEWRFERKNKNNSAAVKGEIEIARCLPTQNNNDADQKIIRRRMFFLEDIKMCGAARQDSHKMCHFHRKNRIHSHLQIKREDDPTSQILWSTQTPSTYAWYKATYDHRVCTIL